MRNRLNLAGWMAVCVGCLAFAPLRSMAADAPATQPAMRAKVPTDQPSPKMDAKDPKQVQKAFLDKHAELVALAKKGDIDLYFEGDSITANWGSATHGKAVWEKEFAGWKPGNFGIGGDRTEHVLWRMENGELDGVKPRAVVLMIGTNNANDCSGAEIAAGVAAIVKEFREKEPQAKILLLSIFPRGDMPKDNPPDKRRKANEAANVIIAKLDDGQHVKFLDMTPKFPAVGTPEFAAMFPGLLHPVAPGYQVWADAIKPTLTEWLGAPATK